MPGCNLEPYSQAVSPGSSYRATVNIQDCDLEPDYYALVTVAKRGIFGIGWEQEEGVYQRKGANWKQISLSWPSAKKLLVTCHKCKAPLAYRTTNI